MCERRLRLTTFVAALLLLRGGTLHAFDANTDPSLVGWWKLDEGAGTVTVDSSPSGYDGTLNGDPQWVPGWFGGALDFDGDDYVDTGNANDLANYTFGVWTISPGAPSSDVPSGPIHREQNYQISWNHSNEIYRGTAAMHVNGVWYAASFETLEADTWYHLAASYDGEVFSSYKNGELITANDTPSGVPTSDGNTLKFARHALADQFFTGIVDDVRVYDRVLTLEELQLVMLGGRPPELAADPSPADEATDVLRDVPLAWTPGRFAAAHDIYIGTSFDDANDADRTDPRDTLVSQAQSETTLDPGRLELGRTYYWRVDEVNAAPDNTIFKGQVWSFTVEPVGYPIENIIATSNGTSEAGVGPENTVNGSGLNESDEHSTASTDMWLAVPGPEPLQIQYEFDRVYKLHEMLVWNYNVQFEPLLGFGIKNATVEYSTDGTDWTVLGDVELAQATAMPDYTANTTIDFAGVAARLVRLTVTSGYGMMGQFGLSEVRFLYMPAHARAPQPADGQTDVAIGTALSWRPGREAVAHDVYLGTAPDALAPAGTVDASIYTPTDLEFGAAYYWRIDEVNEAEAIGVWEGDIWSFITQEYAVIDDMESYDDEDNRIFDAWLDGFVNGTGATVGYFEAPFAERTNVNSGRQSMPLEYLNNAAPFYSEAEYDLGGMDLDTNGANTLRLFVAGQADNAPAPLYVALEDASGNVVVATHPDANITATAAWTEWRIPYSELSGINLSRVAIVYIGLGDRDNPTAGGSGLIFIDDIGYGRPAPVE